MNALLTRLHYRRLSTEQLRYRYQHLERDISTETMAEECGRQFSMGEIYDVLAERGLRP